MGLAYQDLDEVTRKFMIEELELDRLEGRVYLSPWLSELGRKHYEHVLELAIRTTDDDALAGFVKGLLLDVYNGKRVPRNAHTVLAEAGFNRYFVRGLCRRAIDEGIAHIEIVRAKSVLHPRRGSELRVGALVEPHCMLLDLRSHTDAAPVHGVPLWGSGLSCRIRREPVAA